MSAAALEIAQLHKHYGRVHALDGLDMSVPAGAICGLIGPNGAGKTTAFGVIGGLIQSTGGTVNVLGEGAFDARRHRGRVTLLPQDCELNPHTRVRNLLIYYARLQGQSRAEAENDSARVLDEVALSDRAEFKIKQLSHGMRRRVAVAQALIGNPELVLLDEPVSGLDPELVVRMRELFVAQRGKRTLVISSHNLAELEAVCDYAVFLDKGKCWKSGTLTDVTHAAPMMRYRLVSQIELDGIKEGLSDFTLEWDEATLVVEAPEGWEAPAINAEVLPRLVEAGAKVIEVRTGASLEATYMSR